MRLKHPDYIKLVIETYKHRRANDELSPLLAKSTPARLRKVCLNVYKERYEKKDEKVLKDFFGPAEEGRQFLQLIENFETDKFKPLDNYLKGLTERTDDTNVELLAWLIDFKHRPQSFDNNVILNDEELALINKPTIDPNEPVIPEPGEACVQNNTQTQGTEEWNNEPVESVVTGSEDPGEPCGKDPAANPAGIKLKIAAAVCLTLAIVFGGIYMPQQQGPNKMSLGITNTGCMYWAVDHYEPAPCNDKGKGLLVPLDEQKMKYFRKITRKDTITEWSIGKLYYIKNNHDIECYTEGGNYPEEPTRTLRVLSQYMFDKYLRKNKPPATDSLNLKDEKAMTKN